MPVYNLLVIAAAIAIAAGLGLFLQRTNYGRILRATAENRAMAEALGVDVRSVYAVVFTLGTVLGTTGGALVVPTAAASLDMAIEFVIEAFAVVVIGGLGSMRGALVGALIVGLIRALSIVVYPELEMLAIYLIVIGVLLFRPAACSGGRWHDRSIRRLDRRWSARRVLALLPLVCCRPTTSNLLIPFFAYAIALLGFNLLFGYTGLLSFGHAMFLGSAPTAPRSSPACWGSKQFELVLLGGHARVVLRRAADRLLCVRYTGIFFGMLTLAFGMLFHSFLFKFYHLTGGDSGMRVPRMRILGLDFARYNKIELLAGPFYYYCLALLVSPASSCGASCTRRSGCTCRPMRDNAQKAEYLGVRVHSSAWPPSSSRRSTARRRRHPGLPHRPRRSRAGVLDALGPTRVHDRARGFSNFFGPIVGALALHLAAGSAAVADPVLALRARRHPAADRHRLSGGHCRAWRSTCTRRSARRTA